ncbi:MAG: nucleotidyltransferase domain-containing protein [Bacteroidota bacterium]|jgi:predicted nucleotidyltransferase|nr:nucleotidyltransferase domain-containing protein [Saprospiraceae bacterium]
MKADFGLQERDLLAIRSILEKYPEVKQAFIFGSRAKGNYKPGSDVDIALKGEYLTLQTASHVAYELNEETNMPYQFDVLNYHSIQEPALTRHIDRAGICIYEKK